MSCDLKKYFGNFLEAILSVYFLVYYVYTGFGSTDIVEKEILCCVVLCLCLCLLFYVYVGDLMISCTDFYVSYFICFFLNK
jgi:hypothetical protein